MEGKKLAIIGASYLQEPLVMRAKELGIETHVFAWENGATAKKKADFFYPISIINKEEILIECQKIGIDGITSVASDVAVETVNYVAELMGLVGNSRDCSIKSRDKFEMRRALSSVGLNAINYQIVDSLVDNIELDFPFMVKAVDRSGSRGVSLVNNLSEFESAYRKAHEVSFSKKVLIEEYFEGKQYSLEVLSENGTHHLVGITAEFYSGPPHFVEIGHYVPANLEDIEIEKLSKEVFKALDAVNLKEGASHTEIRLNENGDTQIIEIAARMGGDFRDLMVLHATGYDFLENVIRNSLNMEIQIPVQIHNSNKVAIVRYCTRSSDYRVIEEIRKSLEIIDEDLKFDNKNFEAHSSDERKGFILAKGNLDLQLIKGFFE